MGNRNVLGNRGTTSSLEPHAGALPRGGGTKRRRRVDGALREPAEGAGGTGSDVAPAAVGTPLGVGAPPSGLTSLDDLQPCPGCGFVSMCGRCRGSKGHSWRHSLECESLRMLRDERQMLQQQQVLQQQQQRMEQMGQQQRQKQKHVGGLSTKEIAAGRDTGAVPEDSTALRLVLQLACIRSATTAAGRCNLPLEGRRGGPLREAAAAAEEKEEKEEEVFGPQDVVMDGAGEDVDALCGTDLGGCGVMEGKVGGAVSVGDPYGSLFQGCSSCWFCIF